MRLRNTSRLDESNDFDSITEAEQFSVDCIREQMAGSDSLPGAAFRDMDTGAWYAVRVTVRLEPADPELTVWYAKGFGDLEDEEA